MIEKLLLNNEYIKIQVDDSLIIARVFGYDRDCDLMVTMEERSEGKITCYSSEEISCAVAELEDKIKKSNKFRIWIEEEEI